MNKILLGATLIALVTIIGISYFSIFENQSNQSVKVTVAVTKDFGKELMLQEKIIVASGTSALDATKKIANVETSYGGGFVSSINDIESSFPQEKSDWFFYVNGFLAKEGAASYKIIEDDSIIWDYHSWEFNQFQSAILGEYPKYLVNGYANRTCPTLIVYEDEFLDEAIRLRKTLDEQISINVTALSINNMSEHEKSKSNIILLVNSNHEIVSELNEIHDKIGFHAFFNEGILTILDQKSNLLSQHDRGGLIQICQNIWNPNGNLACENVIILISGTDADSVKQSANVIIQCEHSYEYHFGLVVLEQEIIRTPSIS